MIIYSFSLHLHYDLDPLGDRLQFLVVLARTDVVAFLLFGRTGLRKPVQTHLLKVDPPVLALVLLVEAKVGAADCQLLQLLYVLDVVISLLVNVLS